MVYYAHIFKDYDNEGNLSYSVEFPNLKGAFTYGATLKEAKILAKECLNLCLEEFNNRNIERPKKYNKDSLKDLYAIKVNRNIAFALKLKWAREDLGITQEDMANKLEINFLDYEMLEDRKKSDPTLKTIEKLEEILRKKLIPA